MGDNIYKSDFQAEYDLEKENATLLENKAELLKERDVLQDIIRGQNKEITFLNREAAKAFDKNNALKKQLAEYVSPEGEIMILKDENTILQNKLEEARDEESDVHFWQVEFASVVKQRDEARRYARKYYQRNKEVLDARKKAYEAWTKETWKMDAELKEAHGRIAELVAEIEDMGGEIDSEDD